MARDRAAWNEAEARGLGLFFPPLAERFERLEETLQICCRCGARARPYKAGIISSNGPQLAAGTEPPHPPIMIGGAGEKKTLRLVAQYAQACNLFPGPDLVHKLDVLRRHCDDVGRTTTTSKRRSSVPSTPVPTGSSSKSCSRACDVWPHWALRTTTALSPRSPPSVPRTAREHVIPNAAAF